MMEELNLKGHFPINREPRYRIVRNKYGYDAQYKSWWNPFWLPCESGDEFVRSAFSLTGAQVICDKHYEMRGKSKDVVYYNPSDSSVTYK